MDVFVDGEERFAPSPEVEDGMSLMAELADYLHNEGRAMVGLRVNGEDVPPESLQDVMDERPTADIQTLEVTTQSVQEMVTKCLEELESSLPNLPEACRQLAEVFQSDTPETGYDPFRELAMLWGHIKNRELLVSEYLRLDFATLDLSGRPVSALHEELNTVLQEAAQAIQDGDTVLLGDLLEYELAPRAEDEVRIVALLQESAASHFEA